jgi:small subunit ribosomal protein S6e
MELKLVINNKGRAGSKEIKDTECNVLLNKKIGDNVSGNTFGFKNYEFQITGGTDRDGFPMRYDLFGTNRKKILLSFGPCVKIKRKGMRTRKTVRGNTIAEDIRQINLNVVKEGDKKYDEIFPPKVEEKKEEVKTKEKPKEEHKKGVKETPKEEIKSEEKK